MQTTKEKFKKATRKSTTIDIVRERKNGSTKRDREKGEGFTSLQFPSHDILAYVFEPIPLVANQVECLLDTLSRKKRKKNHKELYLTVKNYLAVLGKEIQTTLTDNFLNDLNNLYAELSKALVNQMVNVCFDYDGFYFVLYSAHQVESYFYHLPICVIGTFSEPMQNLFKRFLHFFMSTQKIVSVFDHYYYGWVIDTVLEEQAEICKADGDEILANDYEQLIKTYDQVELIFKEINNIQTSREEIICLANELVISKIDEKEYKIVEVIKNFVELLAQDCIMNYDYNEEDCGEILDSMFNNVPVGVHRIYAVIWDDNDMLSDEVFEMMNNECGEFGIQMPTSYVRLNPQSKMFIPGDYPERFTSNFMQLIDLLND